MAGTPTMISVTRPDVPVYTDADIAYESPADFLMVRVDIFGTGRVIENHILAFADYAGLQTEWEAGAATTVLKAAIDTKLAASTMAATDELTQAQRGFIGYNYIEA